MRGTKFKERKRTETKFILPLLKHERGTDYDFDLSSIDHSILDDLENRKE